MENTSKTYEYLLKEIEDLKELNKLLYSEKKIAEDNSEIIKLMIANSYDSFVLINENAEQFYISDAAVRETGYSIEELKGPIQNVIYPADLEIVNNAWREVISADGAIVRVQYRHKHKFKEFIWYEAVAQNFINNPDIKAVVVNVREISKLKEVEIEKQKAISILNETGKMAKVGGWFIDLTTMQPEWTDETYNIFEIDKNDFNKLLLQNIDRFF